MSAKRAVIKKVWSLIGPGLRSAGFGRVARASSYRDHAETIDVVGLEFFNAETHRTWGTTHHSFSLSCGVYLKFAPNPYGGQIRVDAKGQEEPDATLCAVRTHATRRMRQPRNVPSNVWLVDAELSNIEAVAADVLAAFQEQIEPWFQRFGDLRELLAVLKSAEEDMDHEPPCWGFGRMGSPVRNLFLGFTALAAGDKELARTALTALMSKGGFVTASMSKGGFAQLSGSHELNDRVREALRQLEK